MVKVLAVADEEVLGFESRLPGLDVDLVLSAGDLPWGYLEQLGDALGVPCGFVPGNHDPATDGSDGPHGWTNLDRTVADLAGLRIAGLGGCVRYKPGPHQHTQNEFAAAADRLATVASSGTVDVVLTHAPPFGLGDEPDGPHVGIEALHPLLRTVQPAWHLHGHIHPFGMLKPDRHVGDTVVRNVIPWQVIDVVPRASTVPATRERG